MNEEKIRDEARKAANRSQFMSNHIYDHKSYEDGFYEGMTQALRQYGVISWVAASEKLPSVEQNGNKVLIYRIMHNSQESLAISIHDTSMVKYCNVDETWWMELPKPPCL